jgi:hypothetical protein
MRTNLFLSTLLAVSLLGGAALANKPSAERPAREPRAIQILRWHGDVVDKSYRSPDRSVRQLHSNDTSASKGHAQRAPLQNERVVSRTPALTAGRDRAAP